MSSLQISPNPAPGNIVGLSMNSGALGNVQVTLIDALGRTLRSWSFPKQNRGWQVSIDVGNIQPGNYFISVQTDGAPREVRQFLKK
jgi:hypothetical protein